MKIDTTNGHEAMDYDEHMKTYSNFIRITIASIIFLIGLLGGMALFLT